MAAPSSGRTRTVRILLSESQNSRLNQAARRSGVTKSAFLRVALERELALDQELDQKCTPGSLTAAAQKGSEPDALQLLLF